MIRNSPVSRVDSCLVVRSRKTKSISSQLRAHEPKGVYIVQPDLPSVAGFRHAGHGAVRRQSVQRTRWTIGSTTSTRSSAVFARRQHQQRSVRHSCASVELRVERELCRPAARRHHQHLSGTLVNDFRFSHMYWRNRNSPAGCVGSLNSNCIGANGPEIFYLNSVNFALGNNFNSPQGRDFHRYPISNNPPGRRTATR